MPEWLKEYEVLADCQGAAIKQTGAGRQVPLSRGRRVYVSPRVAEEGGCVLACLGPGLEPLFWVSKAALRETGSEVLVEGSAAG